MNLTSAPLLSLGQLCDDDCIVTFTENDVTATKNGQEIIHGSSNHQDKLWNVKFDQFGNHIKAATYEKRTNQ